MSGATSDLYPGCKTFRCLEGAEHLADHSIDLFETEPNVLFLVEYALCCRHGRGKDYASTQLGLTVVKIR